MDGENPFVQRDMRPLKHRADSHREGLAAFLALVDAGASGLALELRDAGAIDVAALRAMRAIGPKDGLQMLPRLVGIVIDRIGEVDGRHVRAPLMEMTVPDNQW